MTTPVRLRTPHPLREARNWLRFGGTPHYTLDWLIDGRHALVRIDGHCVGDVSILSLTAAGTTKFALKEMGDDHDTLACLDDIDDTSPFRSPSDDKDKWFARICFKNNQSAKAIVTTAVWEYSAQTAVETALKNIGAERRVLEAAYPPGVQSMLAQLRFVFVDAEQHEAKEC
jgi:hypothetical protein